MSTSSKEDIARRPFSSAAEGSLVAFWQEYCNARPSPTEDFFQLILAYHAAHAPAGHDVAHDVGTGPANIAWRLAPYFKRVVGSDINDSALQAGPALIPPAHRDAVTLVKAAAEDLAATTTSLPPGAGVGENDLVVVSECMPLLDRDKALTAFHALLKPRGTLAIYFYGRPFFTDGVRAAACNGLYERIVSRVCRFFQPFAGSPGEPFHRRSAEALVSGLDNIPVPATAWDNIERHKWNSDRPLVFNGRDGYDFDWTYVDRRAAGEKSIEVTDRTFWRQDWDLARVKAYIGSNYPKHRECAGDKYAELEPMYAELEQAMGGPGATMNVSFPVVLILATKK